MVCDLSGSRVGLAYSAPPTNAGATWAMVAWFTGPQYPLQPGWVVAQIDASQAWDVGFQNSYPSGDLTASAACTPVPR